MILSHNIWRGKKAKPKFNGIELVNPLPDMVKDTSEMTQGFEKYNLIPYMGDYVHSSHVYVELLDKLHMYSPTQGAITKSICK